MNNELTQLGISEQDFISESERNEGFGRDEATIPFTRILQPLSPQIGMAPGAQAGAFLNFASGKIIEGELTVIPIFHQWNYTEWTPRSQGGGFIADYGESEDWQDKCEESQKTAYQPVTKDGHAIQKSRHFYVFYLTEDDGVVYYEPTIIPFFGTALKIARQWSSMMQSAPKINTSKGPMTPAYFYYTYKIGVTENKNTKGKWYLPNVQRNVGSDNKQISVFDYANGAEIWQAAVSFRDSFKAGKIKAASQETAESDESDPY